MILKNVIAVIFNDIAIVIWFGGNEIFYIIILIFIKKHIVWFLQQLNYLAVLINQWINSSVWKTAQILCFQLLKCVNIFWFLYSSLTVNSIFLTNGQNKTFEDVILDFGKHWSNFQTFFIDRVTDNKNKVVAAPQRCFL